MKYTLCILCLLCGNISHSIAQNIECSITIVDKNSSPILLYNIVVDDSIPILPELNSILSVESERYEFATSEGRHKVSASMEGYTLLDTMLNISLLNNNFTLLVDMDNDFHYYEFKKHGYNKIVTPPCSIIIGLKDDGTFLKRSFFHLSIVGCFQYESGKYFMSGDKLILNVDNYKCDCFNYKGLMKHQYEYTIKDSIITDCNKYSDFILKNYTIN